MTDDTIRLSDGRTVGFADNDSRDLTPVLWCHGGPGSRLEPQTFAPSAAEAGLRLIGIDRPGYGLSTERPGRTIASWVPDALAVVDHLGIDKFAAVGVSTGGAYALALASSTDRVIGVVACCALTDMRWAEGKAMMESPATADVWKAADRDAALEIAADVFGADGSKMLEQSASIDLPPSDVALLTDPAFLAGMADGFRAMFAQGLAGYVDDRLADGPGWGTFDVDTISCPVVVIHGESDTIVPVAHARHTVEIVPGAALRVFDGLGHFSILQQAVGAVGEVLTRTTG